jgi:benzoyl-CoA reductase/2-hydroxyglutaryl-CoA dehydratase subunit BcrC/BadD/HgdB
MDRALLLPFEQACDDGGGAAVALAAAGRPVIRTLGTDAPRELLLAAGFVPVRLVAGAMAATPRADALMGETALGVRGRRLIEQILDPGAPDLPLLITQADAEQPQIFAALRELARLGERVPSRIHFLDLLHLDRPSSRAYNLHRLRQLSAWLEAIGGTPVSGRTIAAGQAILRRQAELLAQVDALRRSLRIGGTEALAIVGASAVLPPEDHVRHLEPLLAAPIAAPDFAGRRIYVAGTAHEDRTLYRLIESCGALIVGEDQDWGNPFWRAALGHREATLESFADPALRPVPRTEAPDATGRRIAADAAASGADLVLHLGLGEDEAAPWDVASIRRELPSSLPFLALRSSRDGDDEVRARIAAFIAGETPEVRTAPRAAAASATPGRKPEAGQRSRKSLAALAGFGTYQREWFAGVRARVEAGAPFAMVNANAPQEILRALDIPFVVNQWWASIVAAKQQTRRYLGLLADHHYPRDVEAYSSQGLAATFDRDAGLAPWGGLPRPDFVFAVASSDPTLKIFDHWARETGGDCFIYERTLDPRAEITTCWWDDLPERWDEVLEPERIDLMVAELEAVLARIEAKTGRRFDAARFAEVMDLVNEQEEYYRRTRDLVAAAVPAPISIVDSMPATMVPQWHRGTIWGRDAARAFHDEVLARIEAGEAAAPNERIRLMWVGRGLWSDMGFYQKWEESHGAVFVWSMYLALAADGYIRRTDAGSLGPRDPMRALAARFLTMGDELRMPTWAGPWHVHEARTHQVDAAIALRDADPFVVRALRAAGIPVLELPVDNFSREGDEMAALEARITDFIEGPAAKRASARAEPIHVGA